MNGEPGQRRTEVYPARDSRRRVPRLRLVFEDASMGERRRHYRVSQIPESELSLSTFKAQERPVAGQIADLAIGGASVVFDPLESPIFNVGQVIYAEFTSPHLEAPLQVPSIVHRREETAEGRVYGLEFIDWMGLLSRIPPNLVPFFNKRFEPRVEIDPDDPIEVKIEGGSPAFKVKGQLRNVSAGGLSFSAPAETETFLSEAKLIRISFRLPDNPEKLAFIAKIRHRTLTAGNTVRYGVLFDPNRTKHLLLKQEKLQKFISERHRQVLDLQA